MVVFGGYHDEVFENDLWGYGYEKNEWKKVETTGETPRGRSNMSMKYDERNKRVIIFGGKVKKIENESSN
jgi:N-acetylneuraminic acid mutarotase